MCQNLISTLPKNEEGQLGERVYWIVENCGSTTTFKVREAPRESRKKKPGETEERLQILGFV